LSLTDSQAKSSILVEDMKKLYFSKESIQMYKTKNVESPREYGFSEILLSPKEVNGGILLKHENREHKTNSLPDGGWGWVIVGGTESCLYYFISN
jgi:hypothetical protein